MKDTSWAGIRLVRRKAGDKVEFFTNKKNQCFSAKVTGSEKGSPA